MNQTIQRLLENLYASTNTRIAEQEFHWIKRDGIDISAKKRTSEPSGQSTSYRAIGIAEYLLRNFFNFRPCAWSLLFFVAT